MYLDKQTGLIMPGTAASGGGGGGGLAGMDFYKCASVNATDKTWVGYKAVLTDGVYIFEGTATEGLVFDKQVPVVGKIYSADMLVQVQGFLNPEAWLTINDDETLILLEPTKTGSLENMAMGKTKLGADLTNTGVTIANGLMAFDGGSQLEIPQNSLPVGFFDGKGEWTLDIWMKRGNQSGIGFFFGYYTTGDFGIYVQSDDMGVYMAAGPTLVDNNNAAPEPRRLTIDCWNNGNEYIFATYINGKKQSENSWGSRNVRTKAMWIGGAKPDGRNYTGTMAHFSLRAKADHKGENFDPGVNPYA